MSFGLFLILAFFQMLILNALLNRPVKKPVVIGLPDAENKKMTWLAKPEKTRWDEFREGVPFLVWGFLIGAAVTVSLMV